jgi:DNA-binding transcriptional ArsR family regulator
LNAETLRVVAAPRRRAILRLIWATELSAGEIHARLGDVTFGAISQHLRVLEASGLVDRRPEGKQRFYRARLHALGPLQESLEEMWSDALCELKIRAELEESRRGPQPRKRAKSARRTHGARRSS